MSHARQALLVAGWEFRRYFKWKDQAIGFLVFLVMGAVAYGAGRVATAGGRTMTVAAAGVELAAPAGGRLRVVPAPADATARAAALREGEVQGILTRRGDGSFELVVEKDPRYLPELRALLGEQARHERLAASGIPAAELARILAPPRVEVRFTDPERGRIGRGEKLAAGLFTGALLLAAFTSMAYLLTGITGEKQLRVTESIVSAIPPQVWIDGKILGIGAYALTTVANMAVGSVLVALAAKPAWGFALPGAAVRPGVALVLVLFAALGMLLWNSFFAAFASTIDDPNTSARASVMFLPLAFVGMAAAVLRDPDSALARGLALFPLTSTPAMPVRVILSNPPWLEVAASAALLAGTIWLLRRAAGRIFEVGMLMYGKEPSVREMVRWASERRA